MDVRRAHEGEHVAAEVEGRAILRDDLAIGEVGPEVGDHHLEGRRGGDDLGGGVLLHERGDAGGVVGLHVLDDQVVGGAAGERGIDVAEPLVDEVSVDGVHHGNLLRAEDDVGVVRHPALSHIVLPLEEVDVVVVYADVLDILGDLHGSSVWSRLCFPRHSIPPRGPADGFVRRARDRFATFSRTSRDDEIPKKSEYSNIYIHY